jgi:hypothetical protein
VSILLREGNHVHHDVRRVALQFASKFWQAPPVTHETRNCAGEISLRLTAVEYGDVAPGAAETCDDVRAHKACSAED